MEITSKTLITKNEKALSACLDNEIVMMDEKTGEYKTLNETAGRIWQILEEKKSISFGELCQLLKSEYDVSQEVCEAESASFITKMAKENTFTVSDN